MPNVQIRDLPDDVHRELLRRAAARGQSLQQFLTAQLSSLVKTPTLDEVLDRIEARTKGRLDGSAAVEHLDADRARR